MRPSSLGGGRILRRTLSVRLSVRPVIVAIGNVFSSTASITYVLFGTHWGPHIVRPSRPHRFLFVQERLTLINCRWRLSEGVVLSRYSSTVIISRPYCYHSISI